MSDRLTYRVTPGPECLRKQGTTWTLIVNESPAASFARGPNGETPAPVTLLLSAEQVAQLRADGYEVEPEASQDGDAGPGIDPIGKPAEPEGDGDAGPGIDPIGKPKPERSERSALTEKARREARKSPAPTHEALQALPLPVPILLLDGSMGDASKLRGDALGYDRADGEGGLQWLPFEKVRIVGEALVAV